MLNTLMKNIKLKITLGLIILLVSVILFIPYGIYYLGLSNTQSYPKLPVNAITDDERVKELWEKYKGIGSPELKKISPWTYISMIEKCSVDKKCVEYPGLQHTRYVASEHVLDTGKSKSSLMWHISIASNTIWISNNWTIDQVLSKIDEIELQNTNAN